MQLQFITTPEHHKIAYAVIGSTDKIPLLFLHGGPGSDSHPEHAKLFNLDKHYVVMFDQRGCGRSTPSGDIEHNTTQYLINDIEQLRVTLNISRWKVYGGSWGATLALEYAKQYPAHILSIILRGSFAARKQDLDWFIQPDGIAQQHPESYQKLCRQLIPAAGQPLTSRLYELLINRNEERAYQAALSWDHWEATVMGVPAPKEESDPKQRLQRINNKWIYAHYCHHQFFIGEDGVLPGLDKLHDIPVTLIHGRYDQVCPLSAVETLAESLPKAELIVVEAGHGLHETAIREALILHNVGSDRTPPTIPLY